MIRSSLIYTSIVVAGLGCGCSIMGEHSDPDVKQPAPLVSKDDLKSQVLELQKNQTRQQEEIAELNNKLLILSQKNSPTTPQSSSQISPKIQSSLAVNPLAVQPAPIALPVPAGESQNGRSKSQSAESLYTKFLGESKKPQTADAQKTVELMLKTYHTSPLTSNALYEYGNILYDRAKYNESAIEFERLYKIFPDGNKAVSALYKLALCYQKTGHPQEAQEAFQNVLTVYPGSREALDAEKQIVGGGEQ
jgi:TolA-binding protein